MATNKSPRRSADAAAGAATARKLAAAAKIAQNKADEAKKAYIKAVKKKAVASQATDAVSRRYQYTAGPIIHNKKTDVFSKTTSLKDKKTGITRKMTDYDNAIGKYNSTSGFYAQPKTRASLGKGKLKDKFGK
jgi:hypothetical protein